jgi:hypothetical protein
MTNRDRLLKENNLAPMEIDAKIRKEHPFNDEVALLRKEIKRLADEAGVSLSPEFQAYYAEAEAVKTEVKERLNW